MFEKSLRGAMKSINIRNKLFKTPFVLYFLPKKYTLSYDLNHKYNNTRLKNIMRKRNNGTNKYTIRRYLSKCCF